MVIEQREASLPNSDPPSNSATSVLVSEQAPYMVATYVRPPPMFVKGEGCYLWDTENRKYLDFTSGIAVNALGHCDREISSIIAEQVRLSLLNLQFSHLLVFSLFYLLTHHTVGFHLNPHLEPLLQF